jgi:hypothetical protein
MILKREPLWQAISPKEWIDSLLVVVLAARVFWKLLKRKKWLAIYTNECAGSCYNLWNSVQAEAILGASNTPEQAEPHEQWTNDQEWDGQLNDCPAHVAGQEEEENSTEEYAETNTQESSKSMLEGPLR